MVAPHSSAYLGIHGSVSPAVIGTGEPVPGRPGAFAARYRCS